MNAKTIGDLTRTTTARPPETLPLRAPWKTTPNIGAEPLPDASATVAAPVGVGRPVLSNRRRARNWREHQRAGIIRRRQLIRRPFRDDRGRRHGTGPLIIRAQLPPWGCIPTHAAVSRRLRKKREWIGHVGETVRINWRSATLQPFGRADVDHRPAASVAFDFEAQVQVRPGGMAGEPDKAKRRVQLVGFIANLDRRATAIECFNCAAKGGRTEDAHVRSLLANDDRISATRS